MDASLIFTCLPSLRTLIVSPSVTPYDLAFPCEEEGWDDYNSKEDISVYLNGLYFTTFSTSV